VNFHNLPPPWLRAQQLPIAQRSSALVLVFVCAFAVPRLAAQYVDDHNPIGVTGAFEGVITTGCAYNVLNHNARRGPVEDIVVPGAVGKYGLKMTRYYNSRGFGYGVLGTGWTHGFDWGWAPPNTASVVRYPNGDMQDSTCEAPLGVSDGWETGSPTCCPYRGDFRLADGGKVHFDTTNGFTHPTAIIDPYGETTSLTYNNSGLLTRVTEPAGRYLQFTYGAVNGYQELTQVDAYDGQGNRIDYVVYRYSAIKPKGNGTQGTAVNCLTSVDYSDGTHAYYTYQDDNAPENPSPPCPCSIKVFPVLKTCKDVRYKGPMRNICYAYQNNGPHGAITQENYWDGVSGHEGNGPMVSKTLPLPPSPLITDVNFDTTYTEYRGDGPTRTFNYTALHLGRNPEDTCPNWNQSPAPSQFLLNYTDFRGNTTYLGYDTNWYVNSVRDANVHTTSYLRGPPPNAYPGPRGIGQILKITYPGGAHVDYTYQDENPNISGHYVHTVSNERQKVTTYTRNPTTHLVTRIDYPSDANTPASFEAFTYNSFGQVLTHRLRNGAWESFVYGGRGLLLDKYNPKQGAVPSGADPHIHYTYYTAVDGKPGWIDRVKTMTLPANVSGNVASETYEYDRVLDASGVTNLGGAAVAGRGLVTKITHADGKYQRFKYDAYGNKRWEDNELRKATSYTYDDYNRLTSTTDPLQNTDNISYLKPGATSPYRHTTNSVYTYTSREQIVTTNGYDEDWRKTSTVVASGTLNLTTRFAYDLVGNLTDVTDPRLKITHNEYDIRNRKTSTTEAYTTTLARRTVWHYDPANNINQIDRPDGIQETKGYDALNRMTSHTVPRQVPGQNPINLTTRFSYNPSGTLQTLTDANSHDTTFDYDASDRRVTMTYAPPFDNQTQRWAYDNAGNLKSRTTVSGKRQDFDYDDRNRKTGMSWSNGADSATFTYYDDSRLHTASNPTSTVTRVYDAAGHLTQDQQNIPGLGIKTVSYPLYDDDGRLKQISAAGVYDYTFGYDAAGRFETISTGGATKFKYVYNAASNETDRYAYLPNSVTIQQHYFRDDLNRMTSRAVNKNGTAFSTEAYTYDRMNRITEVNRGGVVDDYGYYWDGELWFVNYGNGRSVSYYLDRAGNRQQVTDSTSGTTTYTPNNINQYGSVSGCSINNGLEHEVSFFQRPNDPGAVTYTYINDERLRQVSDASGNTYNLYYDALGRCVKRRLNTDSNITYYIYDGEKPILEYNSTGTLTARNVYGKGIDEILMRISPAWNDGNPMYYAQDHEGSVTHLLDGRSAPSSQTGQVIERYRYDVFGAPTIYDGNWTQLDNTAYNNRFLFTGREYAATYRGNYLPAFSFYEYRARAYNPTLGRFMSEDPKLFDGGDYNLFRYCHNDPVNFTDPMGLSDTAQTYSPRQRSLELADDRAYNFIMGLMQRQFNSAISAGMAGYSAYQAWSVLTNAVGSLMTAQGPPGQATGRSANAPNLNPAFLREGKKDVNESGKYAEKHNEPTGYNIYERPDKTVFSQQAVSTEYAGANQYIEHYAPHPPGAAWIGNAHWHMPDRRNRHVGSSFSGFDTRVGRFVPVMHNDSNPRSPYAIYYQGWRWGLNADGVLSSASPYAY
jgi:RHS repeat-associated protein